MAVDFAPANTEPEKVTANFFSKTVSSIDLQVSLAVPFDPLRRLGSPWSIGFAAGILVKLAYNLSYVNLWHQGSWYFALPILHEDRLVGKLDAAADRKASVLRVNAIHEDVKFTRAMTRAVRDELEDLASWLGLDAVEPG